MPALESRPGVKAAAISSGIPFGAGGQTTTPATSPGAAAQVPVDWRVVSAGYFHAMEIPLLRGRVFDERDAPPPSSGNGPRPPSPAVISVETAQRMWGGADPLGRVLRFGSGREFFVIGVVGGVRNAVLSRDPAPAMYIDAVSLPFLRADVAVRTA